MNGLMLLGGTSGGIYGLKFSQVLDVAWAHLCMMGRSGAFTSPFEVRDSLRYAVWGGEKPTAPPPKPEGGGKRPVMEINAEQSELLKDFTRQLRGQATPPATPPEE